MRKHVWFSGVAAVAVASSLVGSLRAEPDRAGFLELLEPQAVVARLREFFGGGRSVGALDLTAGARGEITAVTFGASDCAIEDAAFRTAQGGCQELSTLLVWAWASQPDWQWDWNQAVALANGLDAFGYSDWRLPTVAELQHLAGNGNFQHLPVDPNSSYGYWSSQSQGKKAWRVIIGGPRNGETGLVSKLGYCLVLCVRNGTP